MQPFHTNLEVLRRRQPELAERILRCRPGPRLELVPARSGAITLRCEGRLEASAIDPVAEAHGLVAHFRDRVAEAGAVRLVIFGLGIHTLSQLPSLAESILVVEPSLELTRTVLEQIDLQEALEHVELVVGEDLGAVLRHPIFGDHRRGLLLTHAPARRRAGEFHDAIAQRFQPGGDPRPLDIAVVPPLYGGSLPVAQACARALRELGHHVRFLDLAPFWPAYQEILRCTADDRLRSLSGPLRAGLVRLIGETLLAGFQLDPPDLVFAVAQAPLDTRALEGMKSLGITRAFWFCEDFRVMPYWRGLVDHFEIFFHIQPDDFSSPLRDAGGYGMPLAMAFDPAMHHPVDLTPEQQSRYGSELSFVGAGYHNRVQFLPALFGLGLRIYGTEWPLTPAFLAAMPEPNTRQSSESSNLIFNASGINLNLHSSPWCDGVNPVGDYLNPRTFELAGARAFQLVDERTDLSRFFEPGREIATFRNLDECRTKIRHYQCHPEERHEMAARAHRRALAEHTYRHRMETAIEALRAGPVPLVPRRRTLSTIGSVIDSLEDDPALKQILSRVDRDRPLDADALSLAVACGEGPLSTEEKLLLFMREARTEVQVLDSPGSPS